MAAAVAGPTPGNESNCAAVAVLRSSGAGGSFGPETLSSTTVSPTRGTTMRWPSLTWAANRRALGSLPGTGPRAAVTASATREALLSRYTPGDRTAPTTCTSTIASAASGPSVATGLLFEVAPETARLQLEPAAARGNFASTGGDGACSNHHPTQPSTATPTSAAALCQGLRPPSTDRSRADIGPIEATSRRDRSVVVKGKCRGP